MIDPEPTSEAERLERYPGWGQDGKVLHDTVPPEMWCITKEDLHFVRRQIVLALRQQMLKPILEDTGNGRVDIFDPEDDTIGPSMYNTVKNYIQPLTREAGSMSWALLRHKDGLKCDIFITHCWAEGAFEFIDKVLSSWPWSKRTAWCCIFANPQNLDIDHLIQTPRTSPFAKALSVATHVMAIPTRKVSIYTRVWCCYEGYLAYNADKIIFTASCGITRELVINLLVGFVLALAVFLVSFYGIPPSDWNLDNAHIGIIALLLTYIGAAPLQLLALLSVSRVKLSAVINVLGAMVASWCFAMSMNWVVLLAEETSLFDAVFTELGSREWPHGWLHLSAIFFFAVNEADRLHVMHNQTEAGQLQNSYHGIRKSNYTMKGDYDAIMDDIGDAEAEVNRSIKVLMDAGMSTPGLRQAAAFGLDMVGAANVRLAICWLCCSYWCALTYSLQTFYDHGYQVLIGLDWFIKAVCIMTWFYKGLDEKAFLGMAAAKIVTPAIFAYVFWYVYTGCDMSEEDRSVHSCPEEMLSTWIMVSLIVDALVLACAVLGRHRVARIPRVGMPVAHVLGPGCCFGCWPRLTAAFFGRQSSDGEEAPVRPPREAPLP